MTRPPTDAARRGGLVGGAVTREKYGPDHFKRIGQLGGAAAKARGTDYTALGAMGGNTTKAKGMDYKAMGAKGGKANIANARNRALEEAEQAALAVSVDFNTTGAGALVAEECARRIRALMTKP